MVERPPPRSISEFGMDGLGGTLDPDDDDDDAPLSLSVGSSTSQMIGFAGVNGLSGPVEQQQQQAMKLPPRSYVSRRASSTLTMTSTSTSTSSIVGKGISSCVGVDASSSSTDPGSPAF